MEVKHHETGEGATFASTLWKSSNLRDRSWRAAEVRKAGPSPKSSSKFA